MKEYVFWFSGGYGPVGLMEDEEAERMKQAIKDQRPGIHEFKDTDGSFLVNVSQVTALAINNLLNHDRKAGF